MIKKAMVCVVLIAAACGKKAEDKQAQPEATTKVVEQPKKPPALMRVPVTSKSPEAIAEYTKAPSSETRPAGQAIGAAPQGDRARSRVRARVRGARTMLPDSEGTDMLAKAGPLAAKLPESERLNIEAAQAMRAGDEAKRSRHSTKVVELAPGQWEASYRSRTSRAAR